MATLPAFGQILGGVKHVLGVAPMRHWHVYLLRIVDTQARDLPGAKLPYLVHVLDALADQRFFETERVWVVPIGFKACPISIFGKLFVVTRLVCCNHSASITILRNLVISKVEGQRLHRLLVLALTQHIVLISALLLFIIRHLSSRWGICELVALDIVLYTALKLSGLRSVSVTFHLIGHFVKILIKISLTFH